MITRTKDVITADGAMETFVVHPERGPSPVVLLYMDAYGVRDELRQMATRLATSGYYVMLPNLYYRSGVCEMGPIPYPDEQDRIDFLTGCVQSLSIAAVMRDTESLLATAAADPAADAANIGTVGYCMSGRFAVAAAARHPETVKAAASIYGTWLISDDPESPHVAAAQAAARIYFACAEHDHWAPLDVVAELGRTLSDAGANAEVEVYPGVSHAFAFPSRHTHDQAAEDRHWERLNALFNEALRSTSVGCGPITNAA